MGVLLVGLFASCSRLDLYYVRHSELVGDKGLSDAELTPVGAGRWLVEGHHIRRGGDLVLLMRRYDRGSLFIIDDEGFKKLTIEIPAAELGRSIPVDVPPARLYYSQASSPFVGRGEGFYAARGEGYVTIVRVFERGIEARVDVTVRAARPPGAAFKHQKDVSISGDFLFTEICLEDLTPWLGSGTDSVLRQAYP